MLFKILSVIFITSSVTLLTFAHDLPSIIGYIDLINLVAWTHILRSEFNK